MTYPQLIQKLLAFPGRGIKTFEAFRRLDRKLGEPHRAFRSVHVGGTNGKGSVSMKIARALSAEGYRVGLYTSPHISSVRERIEVDGAMIPAAAILQHLPPIFDSIEEELSFFDLLTALGFTFFRASQIDWAVVEVGLGGRLDATNVIDPALSVITSIGYEHTEILGPTLEAIAKEKGGIAKNGIPLIAGPTAAPFFPSAQAVTAPAEGFYDEENSAIARAALRCLNISETSIAKGLQARPKCRFERVGEMILDVAHNPDGFRKLIEALRFHFPKEKFHFIVGFSRDKEWEKCLGLIRPLAEKISFVNTHPRLVSLGGGTVRDALGTSSARDVVCGTFYIMSEARRCLGMSDPE